MKPTFNKKGIGLLCPNIIKYACLLIVSGFTHFSLSQFVSNPSFEETDVIGFPTDWYLCKPNSTPDVQPGAFEAIKPPAEGEHYISLVTRGFLGPYAATTEEICTHLNQPLIRNECYEISMDMAISEHFGHTIDFSQWLSYYNPVRVKIWGGTDECLKSELLWISELVSDTLWKEYKATIRPLISTVDYIFIEADYASGATQYFGNVLIDNFQIQDHDPAIKVTEIVASKGEEVELNPQSGQENYQWTPNDALSCENCENPTTVVDVANDHYVTYINAMGCPFQERFILWLEVIIPNIITPNGDGNNDSFYIQGIRPNAQLLIYNRWGVLVYSSANYQNDWMGKLNNGEDVADGVYFYVLNNGSENVSRSGNLQIVR